MPRPCLPGQSSRPTRLSPTYPSVRFCFPTPDESSANENTNFTAWTRHSGFNEVCTPQCQEIPALSRRRYGWACQENIRGLSWTSESDGSKDVALDYFPRYLKQSCRNLLAKFSCGYVPSSMTEAPLILPGPIPHINGPNQQSRGLILWPLLCETEQRTRLPPGDIRQGHLWATYRRQIAGPGFRRPEQSLFSTIRRLFHWPPRSQAHFRTIELCVRIIGSSKSYPSLCCACVLSLVGAHAGGACSSAVRSSFGSPDGDVPK